MNLDLTKTSHQLLLGTVTVVLATMYWMTWSSPDVREAEKFLRANPQVLSALGEVRRVSLRSRGVVQEEREPRKEYFKFNVGGTKSRASVTVTCRSSRDGLDACAIESLD